MKNNSKIYLIILSLVLLLVGCKNDTTQKTEKRTNNPVSSSTEEKKSSSNKKETTSTTEKETTTSKESFEVTVSIPSELQLEVGDSSDVSVTVDGKDKAKADSFAKEWTVSDNTVCSIENGAVTALKEGTANVKVTINGVESNVMVVTVSEKIIYSSYTIEHYFYDAATQGYIEDAELRETFDNIAVGTQVSLEFKEKDNFLPTTNAEGSLLSGAVLEDDGLVLKAFYDEAVAISYEDEDVAYFYSLAGGPTYGNNGVKISNIGDFNGVENVFKVNFSSSDAVLRIVGVNNEYLSENDINKLVMKVYISDEFTMERLYETFYYTDDYTIGLRNNGGNLQNNGDGAVVRIYDEFLNRIYDVTTPGWYRVEFNLNYYGKEKVLSNNSNGVALNLELFVNEDNLNKPFYISEAHFSQDEMDDTAPIKMNNADVNAYFVSLNSDSIIGSADKVKKVELVDNIGNRNSVYKVTGIGANSDSFIRLYGITQNELSALGYERLRFDLYISEEDSYPTVFTTDGIGATLCTDDPSSFKTKIFIRNAEGELIDKVPVGVWTTVEIDISGCINLEGFLHDNVLDFKLRIGEGKSVYLDNCMLVKTAKYTIEYYLANDEGEFELDDFETLELKDSVGALVVATPTEVEGYVFAAENANNVLSGTVLEDGSLVLKLYYDISKVTTYTVKYYKYDATSKTYVEDTELTKTVENVLEGEVVTENYISIDGYLPMTSATGTKTSGEVLKDGALILSLYYNEAVAIGFNDNDFAAYIYSLSGGPTYGNNGVEMSNIGTFQNKNNVYKVCFNDVSTVVRIVGQDNVFIAENNIAKISMDVYVTEDFTMERLYEIFYFSDGYQFGLRNNSGNLQNNGDGSCVRMYDEKGNRIYDFTGEGWVKLEFDLKYLGKNIDNNGNAKAINLELYVNEDNKDIPFYIANAHFSTESMNIGSIEIQSEAVDASLVSFSEWYIIGVDERAYKQIEKVDNIGGKNNVYKIVTLGTHESARLNSFLRIYGTTKEELAEAGITKLCFKMYIDTESAYPTVFADCGATLNSGDVQSSGGSVVVKTETGEALDQLPVGEWAYVEVSITTCDNIDAGACGNIVNFKLRTEVDIPVYISEVEFK